MKRLLVYFIFLTIISFTHAQSSPWLKKVGAAANDYGQAIVTDAGGNVYTTGVFIGTVDFDPGINTFTLTAVAVSGDVFITKFDPTGNFLWAKQIGGSFVYDITLDATNNVLTTGYLAGAGDFDPGPGTFNLSTAGDNDVFISKLDASGNFVWAVQMAGSGFSNGLSISTDASGNIYTTGTFDNTSDFNPGSGTFSLTSSGGSDIFISKLNSSGNFVWAKQFGSPLGDFGKSIFVDSFGDIYVAGSFNGTVDFDPSAGVYNMVSAGQADVFILKLNPSGNFILAKQVGGTLHETAESMTLDALGNIILTGFFQGTSDFDPGTAVYNFSAVAQDAFILKLNPSANFVWAKQIGKAGLSYTDGLSIIADAASNIYTAGYFGDTTDFDPGIGVHNLISAGSNDVFILKLDASGNFIWVRQIGGTATDWTCDLTLDATGNICATGTFPGTVVFDLGPSNYTLTTSGGYDAFILKMSSSVIGIKEYTSRNNISIYPNPTNDILNIELKNSDKIKIEIANTLGQIVFEETTETKNLKLDIKNLNAGLYFLKIISGDKIIGTKKVVKE